MSPMDPAHRERAGWLRRDAERISGSLPPLLVEAEKLVASILPGVHGRRRSGPGETFWQYRPAHDGDTLAQIDWRRSGRSDRLFVREMEWEAAETVMIWADRSASMDFNSDAAPRTKEERGALLALALSVLLARGDERFGLLGTDAERPATGQSQLQRMAALLTASPDVRPDHGVPPRILQRRVGRAVFLSDFFGPEDATMAAVSEASARGIGGILVEILDPVEEDLSLYRPHAVRIHDPCRSRHDDRRASAARYAQGLSGPKLAERRDQSGRGGRTCRMAAARSTEPMKVRASALMALCIRASGRRLNDDARQP